MLKQSGRAPHLKLLAGAGGRLRGDGRVQPGARDAAELLRDVAVAPRLAGAALVRDGGGEGPRACVAVRRALAQVDAGRARVVLGCASNARRTASDPASDTGSGRCCMVTRSSRSSRDKCPKAD